MCYVDAYGKKPLSMPGAASSGGVRPIPSLSYKEAVFSLVHAINFIDNWLLWFEVNDQNTIMIYKIKFSELLKTTPK